MAAHVEYFRCRFSQNNQITTYYITMRSIVAIVYFYNDMTRIVTVNTDVRACAQIAVQPAWAAGSVTQKVCIAVILFREWCAKVAVVERLA